MIHRLIDIPCSIFAIWCDGHERKTIRQCYVYGKRTKAEGNQLLSSKKRNTKKEMRISKGRSSHDAHFSQMQPRTKGCSALSEEHLIPQYLQNFQRLHEDKKRCIGNQKFKPWTGVGVKRHCSWSKFTSPLNSSIKWDRYYLCCWNHFFI